MDSTVSPFKLFAESYADFVYHAKVELEEDTKGLKVAVVGILGDDNSGKSFLMNLIAQYLKNEETGSHGWLDGLIKTKKLITGFEMNKKWCQNNEGLYMWPRPFILKKPGDNNSEEKVAVILLDINMNKVSPSLQMLMCLLCSTVIYNTTTHDISHLCRLITTIKNSCSPFYMDGKSQNFKDLLCQHFTLVFRDHAASEMKYGEDKPLKYLQSLKTPVNRKIIEEIEATPDVNCFLLPKPEKGPLSNEGCLETDKKFTQHIKLLIQKTLTVDNLFLKTYKEKCLNLETFYSVGKSLCYIVIPELLGEYNKSTPHIETNVDEPMDTLNLEADHRNEESTFSFPEQDIEMKDVSNNQHSNPCNDTVAHSFTAKTSSPQCFVRSKVSESHFRETSSNSHSQVCNEAFLASPGNAANGLNSSFSFLSCSNNDENTNSQTHICEVGIRDTLYNRRETQVDTENIDNRINIEVEEFFATSQSKELSIQAERNQETKNERNEDSAPVYKTTENARSLEVQSQFDNCIRIYNDSIVKVLYSFPLSLEKLSETHNHLIEHIKKEVSMDLFKTITPQLDEAYKSCQKEVELDIANCEHAKQVLTHFEKNFAKEYKQGLTSGSFFNTKVQQIVEDSMEVSVDEYAGGFASVSKKSLLKVIYKLPDTLKCSKRIEALQNVFKLYLREINKKLEMYNFFSDDQLNKFHADAAKKSLQPFQDEGNQKLLNNGFSILKKQFEGINKEILRCEEITFKISIIPKVKNFYDVEMKNVTQKKMTSVQLNIAHETLKKECHQVVMKAGSFKEANIPLLKSCFEELDKTLNSGLETHIQVNELKMEKIQMKIQAAIRKTKAEYNETMAKKMGHKALSPYELTSLHRECFNGAAGVLKLEIRAIDDTEDPDRHIENLKMKTQSDLESFTEENNNRWLKEEERKESEKLEAKKQEAAEKIRQREAKFKTEASTDTNINKNTCNSFAIPPQQQYNTQSSPVIAIELGKKKIKTAILIEGKITLIPNRWGELETNNRVAITHTGEILIGDECINRSDVKDDFPTNQLMDVSMKELIDSPISQIDFHGRTISPKKEFLIGLILTRIKSDAENFLEQNVTFAVITVPLWYTSSLRQATKDAATIAGFSTVHLINDTTAAALAYANHSSRLQSKNDFLIVHAVDENIDIAVYSYWEGKVKMESCSGNLHGVGNDGFFKSYLERFKKLWSTSTDKDFMEAIKKLVSNCAGRGKYCNHITECAVIFEGSNSAYLDKLHDIVGKYGRHPKYPKPDEAIIIGASCFADLLYCQGSTAMSVKSDLLPYKIDYYKPGYNGQIFERYRPLSKGTNQSITFESHSTNFRILEVGNLNFEPITTGYVYLHEQTTNCSKQRPINFFISSEGILSVATSSIEHIRKWDFFNLSDEEIANYASLVALCSLNPQQEREKNILEESKNGLKALAQLLMLHAEEVNSMFGKDQIKLRAEASIEAADHPKITQEAVNNRIAVLTKLKTKYLANI